MLKLERIVSFITVVESQSFSVAARRLKVSVPAVSKQMSVLETEIGTQLIQRTTRRLALTEAGLAYYEQCKRLMEEVLETEGLASSLQSEPTGTLRAFVTPHFAEKYVHPYLKEFLAAHPKVRVELELGERIPDPKYENHDLIFGVSLAGPSTWIQKKVTSTRYVFCASPDYLRDFGIPERPKDLIKHRYITHKMRKPENQVEFRNGERIQVVPWISVNDTRSMMEYAIRGLGIVQLHYYVVVEALRQGHLREILAPFGRNNVPVYLYYPEKRFLQPKVRRFIDFFSSKVEEEGKS